VPHQIIWCRYTGHWWASKEWGHSLHRPLLAVPYVTAHPSTASVSISSLIHLFHATSFFVYFDISGCETPRWALLMQCFVLLYNGVLLCGFNVPIKGLNIYYFMTCPGSDLDNLYTAEAFCMKFCTWVVTDLSVVIIKDQPWNWWTWVQLLLILLSVGWRWVKHLTRIYCTMQTSTVIYTLQAGSILS